MNDNKWKYLSFALMAIIAIPTVSNIVAPQAFAAATDSILIIVTDIQSKVNNTTFGLQAIKNAINALSTSTNTNLDAKVSTRATQTSVDNLQTTANKIKFQTDKLPSDPASQSAVMDGMFTKIVRSALDASNSSFDNVVCTSDRDFLIHVAILETNPSANLAVFPSTSVGFAVQYEAQHAGTITLGGVAGESIQVEAYNGQLTGFVTMQTEKGATASCTAS